MEIKALQPIGYSVSLRKNPQNEYDPLKAYGNLQLTGNISLTQLASHIIDHNSTYSRGTVVGVLIELGTCLRELLLQGFKVELGEIGWFEPTISSRGAKTAKEFTAENITALKALFTPGPAVTALLPEAQFRRVTTRAAQAATLAAQIEGNTSADWGGGSTEPQPNPTPSGDGGEGEGQEGGEG